MKSLGDSVSLRAETRPDRVQEPVYTDSHAHLSYVADRLGEETASKVLESYRLARDCGDSGRECQSGSRARILDPGVDPDDFPLRLERFGNLDFVVFAAGIWPSREALSDPARVLPVLERHVAHPRCSAVGECGPDFHHMLGDEASQRELFEAQIELAVKYGKPLLVHSREAFAATLGSLKAAVSLPAVVIHCFGYGPAEAEAFLELGCYISFAGNLGYRNAQPLRDACILVPENRLLLETDAPYMNPLPLRGKPSTCLDIARTYAQAAALRGVSVDSLAATVTAAFDTLFPVVTKV